MGQSLEGLKLADSELAAHVVTRLNLKEETLTSLIVRCLKLLSTVCQEAPTTANFRAQSLDQ